MTLNLEFTLTHLITIGLFLTSSFVGALWALVKVITRQQEERLKERFAETNKAIAGLAADLRKEVETTRKLEMAFLEFKAELPREYQRRDDAIRSLATIEARIDNFALRMERALSNKGTTL
ncbi:MAG: hypothetical protein AB7P37_21245 [Ramlibacter sp.]